MNCDTTTDAVITPPGSASSQATSASTCGNPASSPRSTNINMNTSRSSQSTPRRTGRNSRPYSSTIASAATTTPPSSAATINPGYSSPDTHNSLRLTGLFARSEEHTSELQSRPHL